MSRGRTEASGYREAYDYRVRPEVFIHELVQTIGRAVVDIGTGKPIILDCAWADIELPGGWNMEAAIPRLRPQLKSGLELAEKVNYVLLKDAEKQFNFSAAAKADKPSNPSTGLRTSKEGPDTSGQSNGGSQNKPVKDSSGTVNNATTTKPSDKKAARRPDNRSIRFAQDRFKKKGRYGWNKPSQSPQKPPQPDPSINSGQALDPQVEPEAATGMDGDYMPGSGSADYGIW